MAAKRHHAQKMHSKNMTDGMVDGMRREMEHGHDTKGFQWAEYYAGVDPRRRQEMMDGQMIREDANAIANLPQHVIMRSYPRAGETMAPYLDDTIRGVDHQMDMDDNKKRQHFAPKKV